MCRLVISKTPSIILQLVLLWSHASALNTASCDTAWFTAKSGASLPQHLNSDARAHSSAVAAAAAVGSTAASVASLTNASAGMLYTCMVGLLGLRHSR